MRRPLYLIIYIALLVTTLAGCTTPGERSRMRAGLDSLNQRNRNDEPFTVQEADSFVRFFDKHGTPNDRLLSHYLLGRAHHEAGHAPEALQCYHDALDQADTTAADCDYAQLSRVYGQMAAIFYQQGLYREQLKYDRNAVKYAWLGKDTLAALMNYEQESEIYIHLNDADSAIFIIEDVSHLYARYGYASDAAIALGGIIRTLIINGDYKKAKHYMDIYERESGFFDKSGNIESGREYYYRIKGMYYLSTGLSDSAEYYYRKELQDGKDFNNQKAGAKGLTELYKKLNKPDSVSKYYEYSYAMNDSSHAQQATEAVGRIQAIYNYSRHQEIARQEKAKADNRLILIWLTATVILFMIIVLVIVLLRLQHVKQKRNLVEIEYQNSLSIIEQAQKDLTRLQDYREQNQQLIAEKERIIHEQEIIRREILKKEEASQDYALKQFKETSIYQKLCKYANAGRQPRNEDWILLQDAIFSAYPNYSELMSSNIKTLDDREYKVCLLIRAGFKPNTISSMLEILPSVITMTRASLYLKLFGKPGSSKEFDALIRRVY